MARSRKPKRAEGEGNAPAPEEATSGRSRSRARKAEPAPSDGPTKAAPPPSSDPIAGRLRLLEQALGEIGRFCQLLSGGEAPAAEAARPGPGGAEPAPTFEAAVGQTVPLGEFLDGLDELADELDRDERRRIVDAALHLLEEVYVHLPLKRAMHAIDPVQRLRILRHRDDKSCRAFHDEMLEIFHSLRDLHTNYVLPSFYQKRTAFLPFLVEEYFERDEQGEEARRYVVTKVSGDAGDDDFRPGVLITDWNGVPIARAVERNARREAGSNPDAQLARGLEALTIRPIGLTAPPDERWVIVGFRTEDGRDLERRFPWRVFSPPPAPSGVDVTAVGASGGPMALCLGVDAQTESIRRAKKALFDADAMQAERDAQAAAAPSPPPEAPPSPESTPPDQPDPRAVLGLDSQTEQVRRAKKTLFEPEAMRVERQLAPAAEGAPAPRGDGVDLDCISTMPDVFLFRKVDGPNGPLGYLRIFTFMVGDADAFVAEFLRIVALLPAGGLIVDVRGNGGGNILAGERLLQVLTPRPIEPERFHFLNTPTTRALCKASPFGLDLSRWTPSIDLAIETGETYSQGFPLEPVGRYNRIGQRYQGPVILIVDALCYSTTDIFAAGFQDHRIGPILGTARHTGAGGANVWEYGLLRQALPDHFGPLPKGAAFRVALRRTTRVGANSGVPVEDLGVEPDELHRMTRRDVLGHNEDLIAAAAKVLAGRPSRSLAGRLEATTPPALRVRIEARGVDRVDAYQDGRPLGSVAVGDGAATLDLPGGLPGAGALELRGHEGGELVVLARVELGPA